MNIAPVNIGTYRPVQLPMHAIQAADRVHTPLRPANDSATVLRGELSELREAERALLSELAMGDVNINEIMADLLLVRRSILAAGGHSVLKFA